MPNTTATATLITHAGGEKISREMLATIRPEIEATRTFQPIPHIELIETLDQVLAQRGIVKTREEFAIARNGAMMFGVMDLEMTTLPGVTAALGIRTANDRSMSHQLAVGMRIFVCDNMAFSADGIALRKRHTPGLNLRGEMMNAVDTFEGRYLTMEEQVQKLQGKMLSDDEAKSLMFESFRQELLPKQYLADVAKFYFEPIHADFEPRTAWSLHNAYTEIFKLMAPMSAQKSNMAVSRLLGLTSTKAGQVIEAEVV